MKHTRANKMSQKVGVS